MNQKAHPIASNRPTWYTGTGRYEHIFSDHQHCLKCGKSEMSEAADDCDMSTEDYESYVKRSRQPSPT